MNTKILDYKIDRDEKAEVIKMIRQIKKALKLNMELTPKERRDMASMGNKRVAFVEKIISIKIENPWVLSGAYSLRELKKNYKVTRDFLEITLEIEKLYKQIYGYYQLAGCETFKKAMLVKKQLELECMVNPNYNGLLKDLEK